MKCREGTLQILGVEPSSDGQHSAVDILHVGRQVAGFPVVVVGVVADLVVPQGTFTFEIFAQIR